MIFFFFPSIEGQVFYLVANLMVHTRGSANIFLKGQIVNILAHVDQMVSVKTIQLCGCNTKGAIDNT